MSLLLDAALAYGRAGHHVFPLAPRSKLPLIPARDGGRGLYDGTTSLTGIRSWWATTPSANVGLRTGIIFDVVDLDGPGALDALEAARSGRDRLVGPMVRTAKGFHLLVSATGLGNRAGVLPGVDFRGSGGYVVAPPSVHPSGRRYEWINPEVPLAPAPSWLLELLVPRRDLPVRASDLSADARTSAYARAALRRELESLSRAQPGTRNDQLNRSAFALGQLVGAGTLGEEEVAVALTETGLALGLGERECERTIASGLNAGMANPRTLSQGVSAEFSV
jgi:hypothetical protein